jgi:hypothetical protein
MIVSLEDSSGDVRMSFGLGDPSGQGLTSTELPTYLNLSKFSDRGNFGYFDSLHPGPADLWVPSLIKGTLDRITTVPEPSVLAVSALGIFGHGVRRLRYRQSIGRSSPGFGGDSK